MGRPLRTLHQIHSISPSALDICNIRTTPFSRPSLPKRMEALGFVSKNRRSGKPDHKDPPLEQHGCR
jgi:hypothetical protein